MLRVLARTDRPLSGRKIAELTDGRVGRSRANEILAELAAAGVVHRETHPPAQLYVLNAQHVSYQPIMELADLRGELLRSLTAYLKAWDHNPPEAVWMFGSAARGDGGVESDIDLLVVRPDRVADDDENWATRLADLGQYVWLRSGNSCEILDLSLAEVAQMGARGERLADELREDAVTLLGDPPETLLRRGAIRRGRRGTKRTSARTTTGPDKRAIKSLAPRGAR